MVPSARCRENCWQARESDLPENGKTTTAILPVNPLLCYAGGRESVHIRRFSATGLALPTDECADGCLVSTVVARWRLCFFHIHGAKVANADACVYRHCCLIWFISVALLFSPSTRLSAYPNSHESSQPWSTPPVRVLAVEQPVPNLAVRSTGDNRDARIPIGAVSTGTYPGSGTPAARRRGC